MAVDNSDESPFTSIWLHIENDNKVTEVFKENDQNIGIELKGPFIKNEDELEGYTFSAIEYTINIDTGKTTFLAQSK